MPPLSWQGCISSLGPLGAAESRRMSEYINSHQDMGPLRCEWQPAAVDTVPNPTATHLSPTTHYAQTRACVRAQAGGTFVESKGPREKLYLMLEDSHS